MSAAILSVVSACRWEEEVRPDLSPWEYAQPGQTGLDESSLLNLDSLFKMGAFGGVSSLLILKDDKLVFENYYNFASRDSLQSIGSLGNMLVSMLAGIAIEDGLINSVEDSVFRYLDGYEAYFEANELKKEITFKDLLTMRSGLSWNETLSSPSSPTNDYHVVRSAEDQVGYLLSKPMESRAGQRFSQNSAASLIILKAIQARLDVPIVEYINARLFKPMNITSWDIQVDETGLPNLVFGLSLKSLDLLKFGYLAKGLGNWQNNQLISEEWMVQSTGLTYRISSFLDIGYLWWRFSDDSSWSRLFPVNSTFYAQSDDEQYLFVVPSYNLVVVLQTTEINSYNSNIGYYVLSNFILNSLQPNSGN